MRAGRQLLTASTLALVGLACAAPLAQACEDADTAPSFASWGDGALYAEVPGGSFEEGLTWSSSGAPGLMTVSDDPSTGAGTDTSAVMLGPGDAITSPRFCVDRLHTHLKFVARALEPGANLVFEVLWHGGRQDDEEHTTRPVTLSPRASAFADWSLSDEVALEGVLPRDVDVTDVQLRFSISSRSRAGAWLIDDVKIAVLPTPACPDRPSRRAFEPWGDVSDYIDVPGGAFEDELTWSASGAPSLVAEDNPFEVSGGRTAARLQEGDTITSPPICITKHYPHIRFAARAATAGASLSPYVLWTEHDDRTRRVWLDSQSDRFYREWRLSGKIPLRRALPGYKQVREVRLGFSVAAASDDDDDDDDASRAGPPAWLIDDVFVDPMKRG